MHRQLNTSQLEYVSSFCPEAEMIFDRPPVLATEVLVTQVYSLEVVAS